MSTMDRINRARWEQDQRRKARAAMAAKNELERAQALAAVRHHLATFEPMAGDPLADQIIASARARISQLSE